MAQPKNIYEALSMAQAKVKAAYKSGDNKFDRYHYAKLEDFIEVAKPIMADLGLSLVCSVVELIALEDRKTKSGGDEHAVRVKLLGTLHWTDGTKIEAFSYGEGQDRADKSIYKAITGGKKYLMASLFQIPTTDDPEADETVGQATAKVATVTGEVKKKKPTWTPEQTVEGGALRNKVKDCEEWHAEFNDIYRSMSYDDPADVLEALRQFVDGCK